MLYDIRCLYHTPRARNTVYCCPSYTSHPGSIANIRECTCDVCACVCISDTSVRGGCCAHVEANLSPRRPCAFSRTTSPLQSSKWPLLRERDQRDATGRPMGQRAPCVLITLSSGSSYATTLFRISICGFLTLVHFVLIRYYYHLLYVEPRTEAYVRSNGFLFFFFLGA